MSWIIFSIGVTRHFYIYYLEASGRSYRVGIDSIAAIERLLDQSSWNSIQFVTRFETKQDLIFKTELDGAVERLRRKYRKQ